MKQSVIINSLSRQTSCCSAPTWEYVHIMTRSYELSFPAKQQSINRVDDRWKWKKCWRMLTQWTKSPHVIDLQPQDVLQSVTYSSFYSHKFGISA